MVFNYNEMKYHGNRGDPLPSDGGFSTDIGSSETITFVERTNRATLKMTLPYSVRNANCLYFNWKKILWTNRVVKGNGRNITKKLKVLWKMGKGYGEHLAKEIQCTFILKEAKNLKKKIWLSQLHAILSS